MLHYCLRGFVFVSNAHHLVYVERYPVVRSVASLLASINPLQPGIVQFEYTSYCFTTVYVASCSLVIDIISYTLNAIMLLDPLTVYKPASILCNLELSNSDILSAASLLYMYGVEVGYAG